MVDLTLSRLWKASGKTRRTLIPAVRAKIAAFTALMFAASCVSSSTPEKLKAAAIAEIMAVHDAQRRNHIEKDVLASADLISSDYIAVTRGTVRHISKTEFLERRQRYYDSVEFEKWDDISLPIIRFSIDFSIAYTIVQKKVVITYTGETGDKIQETTKFAWMTVYRKTDGNWKIDAAISTNKPEVTQPRNH